MDGFPRSSPPIFAPPFSLSLRNSAYSPVIPAKAGIQRPTEIANRNQARIAISGSLSSLTGLQGQILIFVVLLGAERLGERGAGELIHPHETKYD